MALKDWLPSAQQWTQLKDAETTLIRRRTAGNVAGVIAVLTFVLQFGLVLDDKDYLEKIGQVAKSLFQGDFIGLASVDLDLNQLIGWIVLTVAVTAYFLLRRTGLLLAESKDPFRYSFYIKPFDPVQKTPDQRFNLQGADRLLLLHHDLTERLNQRIRRFSILEDASKAQPNDADKPVQAAQESSHIQISGTWVVREGREGNWMLQVTPSVRIGPEGSPAKLAIPVRYPLDQPGRFLKKSDSNPDATKKQGSANAGEDQQGNQPITGYSLGAGEFARIVERVYSRIATEVYNQIDSDVREKIKLFPTARLRALALFYEADDFANSNTVDAYQRATDLYRDAMRYFEVTRLRWITAGLLRFPWLLWRVDVNFHNQWARIVTGYAKCLAYRSQISEFAGRQKTAAYELPELLGSAINDQEILYRRISMASGKERLEFLLAAVHYPSDSWINRFIGRRRVSEFKKQKNLLVDLYLADGISNQMLGRIESTKSRLQDAMAVSPDSVESDSLFVLMLGLIEPAPDKRIIHYRRAVELDPDFLMAGWYLAKNYETEFRRRDVITRARAQRVIDNYADLLRINYENILAISAQGYALWLVGDDTAKSKFEEGREIKAIARETFVGELDYRLARVAAENGDFDECFARYTEAKEADPAVGAFFPGRNSRIQMTDYDDIGPTMLGRFKSYTENVVDQINSLRAAQDEMDRRQEETLNTVQCFVLNDYGNACLKYFHYHGDLAKLNSAVIAYKQAIDANRQDAVPWFNVQNAYDWSGQHEKIPECFENATRLAPAWSATAIAAALAHIRVVGTEKESLSRRLTSIMTETNNQVARLAQLQILQQPGDKSQSLRSQAYMVSRYQEKLDGQEIAQSGTPGAAAEEALKEEKERRNEIRFLKRRLKELEEDYARALAEKESIDQEFEQSHERGLKLIAESSRLDAVFEGEPEERIPRIVAIPWQNLDREDFQTLLARAEMLAAATEDPVNLRASMSLAEHLYDLRPGDSDVVNVLLRVVPKLIDLEHDKGDQANNATLSALKTKSAKYITAWEKIAGDWMRFNPNVFLALFWYLSTGRYADRKIHERARDKFFAGDRERFETLAGHVYLIAGHPTAALEAYGNALKLNDKDAQSHYFLGRAYEKLGNWHAAQSAYYDARRLEPEEPEYARRIARTYEKIGIDFRNKGLSQDAADNFNQAIRFDAANGSHFFQLAQALEDLGGKDKAVGFNRAIEAMERAVALDIKNGEYSRNLDRLKRKQQALDVYGTAPSAEFAIMVTPIAIEYSSNLEQFIRDEVDEEISARASEEVGRLLDRVRESYGVDIPWFRWRSNDTDLPEGTYVLMLGEIPIVSGNLDTTQKLCREPDRLAPLEIEGEPSVDPLTGDEAVWVQEGDWDKAEEANIHLIDPLEYILRHLESLISKNLFEFVGQQEVDNLMRFSGNSAIKKAAEDPKTVDLLTEILRALVTERVPLTEFNEIAGEFLDMRDSSVAADIIEAIRRLPSVNKQLPGNSAGSVFAKLSPKFEKLIEDSVVASGGMRVLAMKPEDCQEALTDIRNEVQYKNINALVVKNPSIRIHLRNLVELEFPDLPVLALDELYSEEAVESAPEIDLEPI